MTRPQTIERSLDDILSGSRIEFDEEVYEERREKLRFRLNVVVYSRFRLVAFLLIALCVWLHNRFVLHDAYTWPEAAPYLLAFLLYPVVSWILLHLFYERWNGLAELMLGGDMVMLILAIYFSGGEKSWLFFAPLFRVVDQTHTTFRRAMIWGHLAVGGTFLLLVWLAFGEGRTFSWTSELTKLGVLYVAVFYTALTARSADRKKQRINDAIRVARSLIQNLRESKDQLEEAMHRNELILRSVGEGIVGIGPSGEITFANARAAETIGTDPDDLVGQTGHEIARHTRPDGTICDGTDCLFLDLLGTPEEIHGEHPGFVRVDGSVVPVEFTTAPIFEDGEWKGAVFSFRNIEERKRMERDLVAARDEAEEANQAKSRFLANMTHELRTPLNAILGYAEIIEEELEEGGREDLIADLERVRHAGKHLLGMIDDLLEVAHLETGEISLDLEELDLGNLMTEVAESVLPAFESRGNELIVSPTSLRALADPAKTRRILVHLVENGNKFTEKGRVEISAQERESGTLRVSVADTGIGMTEEATAALFSPFGQLDDSSTKKHAGAGLGLVLSRRLAQAMGGEIEVTSRAGQGSTFTLVLPAAP